MLLETTKYNGTGKYTLESHVTFQKNQFTKIESSYSHVNDTLHNEEFKIFMLLKTIDWNDQCLVSHLEIVYEENTYLQNYNNASIFLMTTCPIKKKYINNKEYKFVLSPKWLLLILILLKVQRLE